MISAYLKLIIRQISTNKQRFISIIAIVILGISFYSGLRSTMPYMKKDADDYFTKQNLMDIEIVSPTGFTETDITTLKALDKVNLVMPGYISEVNIKYVAKSMTLSLLSYDFSGPDQINKPELISGRLPGKTNECLLDSQLSNNKVFQIGDSLNFNSDTSNLNITSCEIVGFVTSPLYITNNRGLSSSNSVNIDGFVLLTNEAFDFPVFTNLYLTIDKKNMSRFSEEYLEQISSIKNSIKKINNNWYLSDIFTNMGISDYKQDMQRISALSNVFPLIFFFVTVLVSLNSITRMVENERCEIGTLKSLGYGKIAITIKYLSYALLGSLIGSIIGLLIGFNLFPRVISNAYGILYNLPKIKTPILFPLALEATSALVIFVCVPAVFACGKTFYSHPANLMRPKSPKPGKRIFLERIKFIWKRLRFIQKVTIRNLFRYKKRFLMTIVGIGGSCALLFTGFGLRDSISSIIFQQFSEIKTVDTEIYLKSGLDESDVNTIMSDVVTNNNITDSMIIGQQSIDVYANNSLQQDIYLIVPKTPLSGFINLIDKTTHKKIELPNDTVAITEKLATLLKVKKGDQINLEFNQSSTIPVTVGNIVENYLLHYVYMSPQLYQQLLHKEVYYNVILGKTNKMTDEVKMNLSQELMTKQQVLAINYTSSIINQMNDMVTMLNTVVLILILSAALLAFLVLFTLSHINIDERKKELATIKVLGFYDKEVSAYVFKENLILTVIGIALGLILGFFLHLYVITTAETDTLLFVRNVKFVSYLFSASLTLIFALIINFLISFRLKKISMTDSLKSIE